MPKTIEEVVEVIRNHRCYSHPIFEHWADVGPSTEAIGALFHQIRCFCDATRPGWNFPAAVESLGLPDEGNLLQEIVESEEDHGPHLATMAGLILNRAAGTEICPDLFDQKSVESKLKNYSDHLLGELPGYDPESGLTIQARRARAVFDRRKHVDRDSTYRNLGTALALEMISNRHLIPGEKYCLVDSGHYGVNMTDPEMLYLVEHWGEIGAEQKHENNAMAAVGSLLNEETEPLIMQGVTDFLDSLASLWDVLDAALLKSGYRSEVLKSLAMV